MFRFQLLRGMHHQGQRTYIAGRDGEPAVIVESKYRLDQLHGREKFRYLSKEDLQTLDEEAEGDVPANNKSKVTNPNGDNVTAQFPEAAENGLTVFEKAGWYRVFRGNEDKPLNDKGLRKDGVTELVEDVIASKS
jgi:hypothetical protein